MAYCFSKLVPNPSSLLLQIDVIIVGGDCGVEYSDDDNDGSYVVSGGSSSSNEVRMLMIVEVMDMMNVDLVMIMRLLKDVRYHICGRDGDIGSCSQGRNNAGTVIVVTVVV